MPEPRFELGSPAREAGMIDQTTPFGLHLKKTKGSQKIKSVRARLFSMTNISERSQKPAENSLSVVEQKLTEELKKEPEDTLLIEEGEKNPEYHLRSDPTGFYAMKVENSREMACFKWEKNMGDATTLLDEDAPRVEYGEIFRYSFEDEMFVPYSD